MRFWCRGEWGGVVRWMGEGGDAAGVGLVRGFLHVVWVVMTQNDETKMTGDEC